MEQVVHMYECFIQSGKSKSSDIVPLAEVCIQDDKQVYAGAIQWYIRRDQWKYLCIKNWKKAFAPSECGRNMRQPIDCAMFNIIYPVPGCASLYNSSLSTWKRYHTICLASCSYMEHIREVTLRNNLCITQQAPRGSLECPSTF